MNIERILNVARALRESPNPDMFNMDSYMHPCGTPSCAFGHYAVRSDLQSAFTAHAAPEAWKGIDIVGGDKNINYGRDEVLEHFGITDEQSDQLFCDAGSAAEAVEDHEISADSFLCLSAKTPNEAADWIERFVKENS